ncbi:MAG: hypothetical protein KC766_04685 [Myxococcales bacterium]|nr:hypothetical protein [Myxococcales bacterium]
MASKKAKPRKTVKQTEPEETSSKSEEPTSEPVSAEEDDEDDEDETKDSAPEPDEDEAKKDEPKAASKKPAPKKEEPKVAASKPVTSGPAFEDDMPNQDVGQPRKPASGHGASGKDGGDHGPEGENIRLGDLSGTLLKVGGGMAVVGLGGAAALGATAGDGFAHFFHSYLVAFWWGLTITLGSLFFILIQHLTKARWSPVVRRVAEIFVSNMPALAVLSLVVLVPVILGNSALYPWNDPHHVAQSHVLQHKEGYLNKTFFLIRWVFYFAVWIGLGSKLAKNSVQQDVSGDPALSRKSFALSAPGMLLFALTTTFGAIDMIMSLEPEFFSTMFGVYVFAGCQLSFHCVLALTLLWLQGAGRLTKSVSVHHFHDIGKMMFAFIVFWAYIAFSQFMLIWYADIPEETVWFKPRFVEGWQWVSIVQLVGHFVIPFFGLVSRHVKRNRKALAFWAIYILVVHYIDLYWLIMPSYDGQRAPLSAMDLLALIGVAGVLIANAARVASGINLRPTKDPRLAKSLAFENF